MIRPLVALLIVAAAAPGQDTAADGFPLPPGAVRRFGNRQLRHPDGIAAMTVSPDGKLLATASAGGVTVWDSKTLTARRFFKMSVRYNSQTARGGTIAFIPDSNSLLISVHPEGGIPGGDIDLAQVWDIETGQKKFGLSGTHDYHAACWVAAGGKELVELSNSDFGANYARFYNPQTGKPVRVVPLPPNHNPPWVGPSGNLVATHGQSRAEGGVVDVRTGDEVHKFPETPLQVAFSRDDRLVVWVDKAGTVHVHDLGAKKKKLTFAHPEKDKPGPMVVSADGKTLYFGSSHGRLFRWDLANNKKGPDFANRHNFWSLTALALSPDESVLYSAAADHLVKRWDVKTGKELPLPEGYTTHIAQVIAGDGKHLILTDHEGQIDSWDLATGKRVKQLQKSHLGGINHLAESADGKWLAGGRTGQDVRLFDLTTGKVVWDRPLGDNLEAKWSDPVQRVGFSPDGTIVYATSQQTELTAWEVPGGKKLWKIRTAGYLLTVDPAGRWLATGKSFGAGLPIWLDLWDARTGAAVAAMQVEQVDVPDPSGKVLRQFPFLLDLAWSPDGSWVVSAHYDGSVRVWDPARRAEVRRLPVGRYAQAPRCLGVSADGKWVAVGGPERGLSVWELATGTKVLNLAGHDSYITQVAFTRDGRGLVSNADLSPILWDLCPKDLPKDGLWEALASADGAKAYRAQWALVKNSAAAVQLFGEQIKPAELTVLRTKFDQWVADLDSPKFAVREAAEKALATSGGKVAVGWLRKALADAKGDEPRARLTRVLTQREKGPDPEAWRASRAVQVLELARTPEAVNLLKTWAAGGSPLTDEAAGALGRVGVNR